ncbi:S8 family peptidase [Bacillus pseudomycoides]|uniref:S8 family peptidase n=1 Tax=Bacillus pseudomycoides TaxID=64104 RepID=UPI000535224E|nr:S8 family peptidase [Bacillus pseudomycoides]MED1599304.1 S8 family peptidase [Bacillus pseudomycoides]
MKKLLIICLLLFCICGGNSKSFATEITNENDYLIMFKDKIDTEMITNQGGKIKEILSNLSIVKAEFSYDPSKLLKNNSKIIAVEQDENVKADGIQQTVNSSTLPLKAKGISPLTGKGTSVAILDTGIDKEHLDLKIKTGISFVSNTSSFDDDNGHGTHLAGIIGAKNNNVGITGIAPDVDLYAVKVLDKYANGKYSTVVKGIDWAIEQNVDIILMSLGGKKESVFFEEAMNKAYQKGILLIASAGNEGYKEGNSITYPAKFNSVVAVGAVDLNNQRGFLSSKGEQLELMALGVDVLSTWNDGTYRLDSGTSMAAAHVAGIASLLLEKDATMSNQKVREILNQSAIPFGNKLEYGNGKVSLSNALKIMSQREKQR